MRAPGGARAHARPIAPKPNTEPYSLEPRHPILGVNLRGISDENYCERCSEIPVGLPYKANSPHLEALIFINM